MCRSLVDIHSATAEIRRGNNRKNKNIMSASAMQGGHTNVLLHRQSWTGRMTLWCDEKDAWEQISLATTGLEYLSVSPRILPYCATAYIVTADYRSDPINGGCVLICAHLINAALTSNTFPSSQLITKATMLMLQQHTIEISCFLTPWAQSVLCCMLAPLKSLRHSGAIQSRLLLLLLP